MSCLPLKADGDASKEIDLEDFLRLVESQKIGAAETDDTDTVEAFVALGGKVYVPVLLQIVSIPTLQHPNCIVNLYIDNPKCRLTALARF